MCNVGLLCLWMEKTIAISYRTKIGSRAKYSAVVEPYFMPEWSFLLLDIAFPSPSVYSSLSGSHLNFRECACWSEY